MVIVYGRDIVSRLGRIQPALHVPVHIVGIVGRSRQVVSLGGIGTAVYYLGEPVARVSIGQRIPHGRISTRAGERQDVTHLVVGQRLLAGVAGPGASRESVQVIIDVAGTRLHL